MKYSIFTLGCQMNHSDSERIAAVLENLGFTSAPEKEADLIVANLCSVRQKAVDRIWGKLKVWQNQQPKPLIYLTGCILPADRRKLEKRVDGIFEIADLAHFPTLLKKKKLPANIKSKNLLSYLNIIPKRSPKNSAYIPIMTGCNNFCSYCAVPYTRGREISRPKKDILSEIKDLIKNKYRYFLLLGQNVNSYGKMKNSKPLDCVAIGTQSQNDNSKFINLLKEIDNLPGDFKFNFISSNPHDMSQKLIKTFAQLKKWDKNLHLAMQSGDDRILKKMNRQYTANQFLKLIEKLKSQISNLKISTDIIVGFPNESKKAFLNTLNVCRKANFDKAYIAMYSPRPGTLAAQKFEDNVAYQQKKHRWKILDDLINH